MGQAGLELVLLLPQPGDNWDHATKPGSKNTYGLNVCILPKRGD
jgi:hypothetical protein